MEQVDSEHVWLGKKHLVLSRIRVSLSMGPLPDLTCTQHKSLPK